MTVVEPSRRLADATRRADLVEVPSLADRAPAWDAAVAASQLPSPFLLSWWLAPHAEETSGATYVLVLDEGGELLGGLAARLHRTLGVRRIRLLGTGLLAPDHLDLVAVPGHEVEVIAAIARWFASEPSFLDLRGVAHGARLLEALPRHRLLTRESTAPFLALDPSDQRPVKPLHRGQSLRRQLRQYERDGAEVAVSDGHDLAAFDQALARLRALHVERWGDGSGFARAFPLVARVARAAAVAGAARITELRSGDEAVASEITFDVARRRHRYQAGRAMSPRWAGAGNVLVQHVVRSAQEEGCVEVDFLRGAEPYKYDWTTTERDILRARAAHGGAAGVALVAAALAERARPAARSIKAWIRTPRARRPERPA